MRLSLESEGQVGQKNLLKRSIFFSILHLIWIWI
jgi:hypothetical protein